jgi:hypothetical protein
VQSSWFLLLIPIAIVWSANHLCEKLQSIEWLLMDIKNYLDNRFGDDDHLG